MDRSGVPRQVLLAGVGVGAEAVAALVATVMLLVGSGSGDLPIATVLAESALFLLGTAALAFVAWGLE
ncbi:MAG: hypothetical protein L0H84_17905, partial [Pseudonocardia sp.]|nr:hypothetical protein [Pseudonocardia sp.]